MTHQYHAEKADLELFKEEKETFVGSYRVPFKCLAFDTYRSRNLSAKNTTRIIRIYKTWGCHKLQEDNHIAAVVTPEVRVLLPPKNPKDPPWVDLDANVMDCLYGQHRVEAARRFLAPRKHWWCVDVYEKVPVQLEQELRDEYQNAQNHSDGEIFWNILSKNDGCTYTGKGKWWARLSVGKASEVKALLRSPTLQKAFVNLLPFKGLWPTIELGALHRLLTLKCEEEISHYLSHVREFWCDKWGETDGGSLDAVTVERLQSRSPGRSQSDLQYLTELYNTNKLFMMNDQSTRKRLWEKFMGVDILIPSFFTFFEDLIQLEALAAAVKNLINFSPEEESLRIVLKSYFQGPTRGRMPAEISESRTNTTIAEVDCFDLAYKQLWLFAMRHYPELTCFAPKKEPGQLKPVTKEYNSIYALSFAKLARKLQFSSTQISLALESNAYEEAANKIVRDNVFSGGYLDINCEKYRDICRQIGETLKDAQSIPSNVYAGDDSRREEKVARRCGRPYENAYQTDKTDLFLPFMRLSYDGPISSLDIRKSFFHRFWGEPSDDQANYADEYDTEDFDMNDERTASDSNATSSASVPSDSSLMEEDTAQQAMEENPAVQPMEEETAPRPTEESAPVNITELIDSYSTDPITVIRIRSPPPPPLLPAAPCTPAPSPPVHFPPPLPVTPQSPSNRRKRTDDQDIRDSKNNRFYVYKMEGDDLERKYEQFSQGNVKETTDHYLSKGWAVLDNRGNMLGALPSEVTERKGLYKKYMEEGPTHICQKNKINDVKAIIDGRKPINGDVKRRKINHRYSDDEELFGGDFVAGLPSSVPRSLRRRR